MPRKCATSWDVKHPPVVSHTAVHPRAHAEAHLDNRKLSSSNIQSINISSQSGESLLRSVRSDKCVDLDSLDVVQLLKSLLDLSLVGLDIDDEDKGVVLLDLLHCALGVERVYDDLVGIETGLMRDRLSWVFWGAAEL